MREFALVESAISSNRIEGVEIDRSRINTVVFGNTGFKDRNEEEIHGYRQALQLIHSEGLKIRVNEKLIKRLHSLCRGEIRDAGMYKEKDGDIIQTYPNGRSRVRFRPVSAKDTPQIMRLLVSTFETVASGANLHPLIIITLFNLDFLCIHPFRDGNGRVSRLLFLLQLYHYGYEVGQFISLERLVEENKERYYETLEESSKRWREGKNDPWPYVNFMLFITKQAYKEFEERAGVISPSRGDKTFIIRDAIEKWGGNFSVSDIKQKCPEVSIDLIRKVLKDMKKEGLVDNTGKGRSSVWYKLGTNG